MKKYSIIFHPDAEEDIRASFEWGCRVWGKTRAKQWVRELRMAIKNQISAFPESCPLAPESQELNAKVRQLVVQRYRVLFIISGKEAYILHVRGPFVN